MARSPSLLALVDDDADVRRALERLIASAGFAVESFASGADFLESVATHEPDCVVLDLHMPAMGGFDVAAALARAHAGIPVIFITGFDSIEARANAQRLGVGDYFVKPVDGDALLAAIGAAIGKRR